MDSALILDSLTAEELQILRHTIADGAGYRNYLCASDGWPVAEALVHRGLFERGGTYNNGDGRYYRATLAGVEAATKARVAEGLRWFRVFMTNDEHPEDPGTRHLARSHSAAKWDAIGEVAEDTSVKEVLREYRFRVRLDEWTPQQLMEAIRS